MNTLLLFTFVQILVTLFFAVYERIAPYKTYQKDRFWWRIWASLGIYASIWLQVLAVSWAGISISPIFKFEFTGVLGGIAFYLFYSHGNYWFHRFKHSNNWFWKHVHALHHAPRHMEVALAFFRHPIEIAVNSIYLILIGKVLFDVPFVVIFSVLVIEGCLETFHHANIKWPRSWDHFGRFIQTPPMHLVHHESGKHSGNYSPIFWDYLYGTSKLNSARSINKLGLKGRLGGKIGNLDLTIFSMLYRVRLLVTKITNYRYSCEKAVD